MYIGALSPYFSREKNPNIFSEIRSRDPQIVRAAAIPLDTVLVPWVRRLHETQSRHSFKPQWSSGIATDLTICGSRVRISEIVLGLFFEK